MLTLLVTIALAEPPTPCPAETEAPATASDVEEEPPPTRSEMLQRLGLDRPIPAAFQPEKRGPVLDVEHPDAKPRTMEAPSTRLREPSSGRGDLDLPIEDWP